MSLIPVIGLEIHVQLKTKSKMFCPCDNRGESVAPNTTICPICTGHPGTLPSPNKQAIEWAVKAALALGCDVAPVTKFDRKHYFYPDLPKGYQISQYDEPVGRGGWMEIAAKSEIRPARHRPAPQALAGGNPKSETRTKRVHLNRVHMEEDAGKLIHPSFHLTQALSSEEREQTKSPLPAGEPAYRTGRGKPARHASQLAGVAGGGEGATLVDFNRAGTPLIEIVTEPDFRNAQEARIFLEELKRIVRYLGISDADMEKGHLRVDANISLHECDQEACEIGHITLNPKTEIKNLNSFKAVERALEYEIMRQTKLWEAGAPVVVQATRGWDEAKQVTVAQRSKEEAQDYRYFPEPDIPPIDLTETIARVKNELPEMPAARRARFVAEYQFSPADAAILTDDPQIADYVEQAYSELVVWLKSLPDIEGTEDEIIATHGKKLGKLIGGWITSKLFGILADEGLHFETLKVTPENFAEFLSLIYTSKISSTAAQVVLREMVLTGIDPTQVMEEKRLGQVQDYQTLAQAIDSVIAGNPEQVAEYKKGKVNLIQFLVGKVMKETEGKADPVKVREMLASALASL